MDFIKKYWPWLLLVPVAAFFIYRYAKRKAELSEKMSQVRAARKSEPEIELTGQNNDSTN